MNNTCLVVMIVLCSALIAFGLVVNAAELDLGVGIHVVFLAFLFLCFLLVVWSHRLSSLRAENKSYCVLPCFQLRHRRPALSQEDREKLGIRKAQCRRHLVAELTCVPSLVRRCRRAMELEGAAESCVRAAGEKCGPPSAAQPPPSVKSFEATAVVVPKARPPRPAAQNRAPRPPGPTAVPNGRARPAASTKRKRYVVNNSFANPNRYLKTSRTLSTVPSLVAGPVPSSRLLASQRGPRKASEALSPPGGPGRPSLRAKGREAPLVPSVSGRASLLSHQPLPTRHLAPLRI